jgi:glycosyltransferase involved in cell wall biosynthesis
VRIVRLKSEIEEADRIYSVLRGAYASDPLRSLVASRVAILLLRLRQLRVKAALIAEELTERNGVEDDSHEIEALYRTLQNLYAQTLVLHDKTPAMRAALSELTRNITLPRSDEPDASIIISSGAGVSAALRCLKSIAHFAPTAAVDVLLLADIKGQERALLSEVRGLHLLDASADEQLFAKYNFAAATARGRYLMFLDANTTVSDGWLDALLSLFRSRTNAALVAPKILKEDGTLCQAGNVIWRDGSETYYGRFDDPSLPKYNYVRETDGVSAEAVLVDSQFFRDVGGFDLSDNAPIDLAFKARSAGFKVWYQPTSVIASYASHDNVGASPYTPNETPHRRTFCDRWRKVLLTQHFDPGQHVFLARDRSRERVCILVLDHYIPQPDKDAGSRTVQHVIHLLQQMDLNVKFCAQHMRPNDASYMPKLQQLGIETFHASAGASFDSWIKENGRYIDYVFVSRPSVAVEYLASIRESSTAEILFYGHDIHHLRIRRQMSVENNAALDQHADYFLQMERQAWQLADVIYYPSEDETEYVRQSLAVMGLKRVVRILPGWAYDDFPDQPDDNLGERRGILFVGGFDHTPNVDAVKWFASSVLPLVLARRPDVHVSIVGSNGPAEITALEGPRITVSGFVTDERLAELYRKARVAIAPVRFGAGVKGKVVEAMRYGVPIVTTTTGGQGLPLAGVGVPQHDDAAEFAQAVITMLEDDEMWRRVSASEQSLAKERFSSDKMRELLLKDITLTKSVSYA